MNPAVAHTSVPWSPEPEHTGELIRLHKLLAGSAGRFSLILACYDQQVYRDRLVGHLRSVLPGLAQTVLDANDLADIVDLERYLTQHTDERGPLHVVGLDRWFSIETGPGLRRIAGFNLHRDYLAALARRPLFLWLLKHQVQEFARLAPDAWEWRAAVIDFARRVPPSGLDLPARVDHEHAPREEQVQRIDEIERFLSRHDTSLSPGERAALWDEIGELHRDLGDWGAAARAYEVAQGQCELGDDQRGAAQARANIAYLLWHQGDPDQALRSLATSAAAFERLGDVRSKAVTQGRIADILEARGQLDEALRIRQEEQLPAFERVGDVRAKAITQGQIADILEARGQFDEALRIRQEEELLVFERLGDVRSKAVTQGRIADNLQVRGRLDESLRIRQEEELPVYERLGDVREKAVTQGKIADILVARGQLDEPLRIRKEEELPVFERLGDVRAKAMTQGKIADILEARGQLDEALRIRKEEELPVYERLGDVRAKSVALFKVARMYLAREAYPEAMDGLAQAYAIVEGLQEAQGLAHVGKLYGQLLCASGEQARGRVVLEKAAGAFILLGQDDEAQAIHKDHPRASGR